MRINFIIFLIQYYNLFIYKHQYLLNIEIICAKWINEMKRKIVKGWSSRQFIIIATLYSAPTQQRFWFSLAHLIGYSSTWSASWDPCTIIHSDIHLYTDIYISRDFWYNIRAPFTFNRELRCTRWNCIYICSRISSIEPKRQSTSYIYVCVYTNYVHIYFGPCPTYTFVKLKWTRRK